MKISAKRCSLAAAISIGLGCMAPAFAQLYYQNFDISAAVPPVSGCNTADFPNGPGTYPFPAGMLKRNVDNRTPAANVAYVNEAWEVREDFSFNVLECAAFSTSWYSPAGAANDWMWTPAINLPSGTSVLSWRAVAYDVAYADGYEVRVMTTAPTGGTGTIGNQLTNSTVVYSTAAEASTWTSRAVDLGAYAGQQVYIGFRNNSNDKFLLLIDDVKVIDETPNLAAAEPVSSSAYPRVADGNTTAAQFSVRAANLGGSVLTNIVAEATIKLDGVSIGPPLLSTPVPTLAIGAAAPISFPMGFTFNAPGQWTISYKLTANESPQELNLLDNEIESNVTSIGSNEFARHALPPSSTLGIGAGNGGEIGVQFDLLEVTSAAGIRFSMNTVAAPAPGDPSWAGQAVVANLRSFDTVTGKPGAILATTQAVTSTLEGGVYDAGFVGGPQVLPAGRYVLTVVEPVAGAAMPLLQSSDRFAAGTGWIDWPTNPLAGWSHPEDFGSGFAKVPNVSLLTELPLFKDGFDALPANVSKSRGMAASRMTRKPQPTQIVSKLQN